MPMKRRTDLRTRFRQGSEATFFERKRQKTNNKESQFQRLFRHNYRLNNRENMIWYLQADEFDGQTTEDERFNMTTSFMS